MSYTVSRRSLEKSKLPPIYVKPESRLKEFDAEFLDKVRGEKPTFTNKEVVELIKRKVILINEIDDL